MAPVYVGAVGGGALRAQIILHKAQGRLQRANGNNWKSRSPDSPLPAPAYFAHQHENHCVSHDTQQKGKRV